MTSRALLFALAYTAVTCPGDSHSTFQTSRDIWRDVLEKCAGGAQFRDVMFFSVSNNIGPGSIWRHSPDGRYILVRPFDPKFPGAAKVINKGNSSSCSGTSSDKRSFGVSIGVENLLGVLPVSLSPEFKTARSAQVSVGTWAWEEVADGYLEDMISRLQRRDSADRYVADLRETGLVIGRAVRADSITAILNYDKNAAATLQAKYPSGVTVSGKVSGAWQGTTSLKEVITQPSYLAVEMYHWTPKGLSAGNTIRPIKRARGDRIDSASVAAAVQNQTH